MKLKYVDSKNWPKLFSLPAHVFKKRERDQSFDNLRGWPYKCFGYRPIRTNVLLPFVLYRRPEEDPIKCILHFNSYCSVPLEVQ